ncbi:SGNH/GDSL hydrolase family protein [Sphingobacterium sp. 18053]|uniref:SGNH/GDSL hydrolase family protein n=1 Tax=Sphingobacterium sp. 18053 TaxID=2681401 RepID=UPI00135C4395|nr:SGNH/GDSL hydrolase family protein [Sphingobacterium sp. 18053]
MKKKISTLLFIILICSSFSSYAQQVIPASKFEIQGRPFENTPRYHRVDTLKYKRLPAAVKKLYTHATGMYVTFKSNTGKLSLRWKTVDAELGNNSTPIMSRGFDAYVKEANGWRFAGVARPDLKKAESNAIVVEDMANTEKEFLLYFPLYKELLDFEVIIDEKASFLATRQSFNKTVVVYGSSIVHGASASRPGLAYPAQLGRRLNANVINMGVSGNARMEPAVADMLGDIGTVDLFILDCVPNSSPEEVKERTFNFVARLRKSHPGVPILLIESITRQISNYNLKWKSRLNEQNKNFRLQYEKLLQAGYKDLYYLPTDHLIGDDSEGTVDGTHPTDVGFERMLKIIGGKIETILNN